MHLPAEKQKEVERSIVDNSTSQKNSNQIKSWFLDNRSEAVTQRKFQKIASNSLQMKHFAQLNLITGNNIEKKETNRYIPEHDPIPPTHLDKTVIQKKKLKTTSKQKKGKKATPNAAMKKANIPKPKARNMTVRNKGNSFSSGWITKKTIPTGVDKGPRAEAQKVADFLGGNWVGGHMVNDQLGGTGGYDNIVPITSSMNGRHKTIENKANNLLDKNNGTSINYKMKILKRKTAVSGLDSVHKLPVSFQQTLEVRHSSFASNSKVSKAKKAKKAGKTTLKLKTEVIHGKVLNEPSV